MNGIVDRTPGGRPSRISRARFWLAALLWVPMGIAATAVIRGFGLPLEPQAWLSLLVIAPCGLPLAFAWSALRRLGYPGAARAVCGVLAVATIVLSLFAGLLGPVAIAAYAIVASLPAWIMYAILHLRVRADSL